jgi:hemoglobin-like flavoprotein
MALHEQFGDAFTPELEQAWATVYGDLSEAMIAEGVASAG